MAFDPVAGRVGDFGLGVPNEGINTGAYDPVFNRIYGLTHPRGHFVYYDVASRKSGDKGRVNNWESLCRTLGIDDESNVYGSFGVGQIFRYDLRRDSIHELAIRPASRKCAQIYSSVLHAGIPLGFDNSKHLNQLQMCLSHLGAHPPR